MKSAQRSSTGKLTARVSHRGHSAGLEMEQAIRFQPRGGVAPSIVAAWDFSLDIPSQQIFDASPNRLHGRLVNMPARAMKGYNWSGDEQDWKRAPSQYGAIHFHDDDLYDAGWDADFTLTIPEDDAERGLCGATGGGSQCRLCAVCRAPRPRAPDRGRSSPATDGELHGLRQRARRL